jgi:hypothetical protein
LPGAGSGGSATLFVLGWIVLFQVFSLHTRHEQLADPVNRCPAAEGTERAAPVVEVLPFVELVGQQQARQVDGQTRPFDAAAASMALSEGLMP